jgi:DNA-binding MarR family transcriptional regulator
MDELADANDGWPPLLDSDVDAPVIRSVHAGYHALSRVLARATREHGLESSEAVVLAYLRSNPGCSAIEVRRRFGFHRSTLSSLLNRLEADGLIVRLRNSYDGRRYEVKLTPAGRVRAGILDVVLNDVELEIAGFTSRVQRRGALAVFEACIAIERGD